MRRRTMSSATEPKLTHRMSFSTIETATPEMRDKILGELQKSAQKDSRKLNSNLRGISLLDMINSPTYIPVENLGQDEMGIGAPKSNHLSLDKLLAQLVDPSTGEETVHTILISYPTFISSLNLLTFLCQEYWKVTDSENVNDSRQYPLHPKKEKIFQVIKTWIEFSVDDFKDVRMMFIFANWQALLASSQLKAENFWAKYLRRIWEIPNMESMSPGETPMDFTEAEKEEKKLRKCKTEEVFEKTSVHFLACQLTLMDYELFKNLKINVLLELLNDDNSGLIAVRDNFNLVTQWLMTAIISEMNLKQRTKVLAKIINIGTALLRLNNLNGLMKVVKALSNPLVYRLQNTWKALSNEDKVKWQQLSDIMSPDNNYAIYREIVSLLKGKKTSFVPSFSIVLEELENVNKKYSGHQMTGVNFEKLKAFSNVMMTIKKFQHHPYNILRSDRIQKYFREELYFESIETLIQFSKKCESGESSPSSSSKKDELVISLPSPRWSTSESEQYFSVNRYAGKISDKPPKPGMLDQMNSFIQKKDGEGILSLLKAGFPMKRTTSENQTFFHIAAEISSLPLIEFLIENGLPETKPDINGFDAVGWTCLHIACNQGHLKVIKALIRAGARSSTLNRNGATPLHYIVRHIPTQETEKDYIEIMEELVGKNSSNVNVRDINLETPLHRATTRNNLIAVQYLVNRGADANTKNNLGESANSLAAKMEFKSILDVLSKTHSMKFGLSPHEKSDVMQSENWILDTGNKDVKLQNLKTSHFHANIENIAYYANEYSLQKRENLIGKDPEQGVVIVSILPEQHKMLIRTKMGDKNVVLPKMVETGKLIETMRDLTMIDYTPNLSEDFSQFIMEAEDKITGRDFSFDILSIKEKQFTLDQAILNSEESHSPAFQQFLSLMGKKVPIGGWGGLAQYADEESEENQNFALHTKYHCHEHEDELDVFFNVSTFMNPERTKAHLGTRSVVIIFLESSGLDLNIFSHSGHSWDANVLIVVQPQVSQIEKEKGGTANSFNYKVTVCYKKNTIRDFGPPLPYPSIFEPNQLFKDFLLTKIINAEFVAMSSSVKKQIEVQRDQALQQLLVDFKNLPSLSGEEKREDAPAGRSFYKIGDELGRGATGIVYKAVHRHTRKEFCVKVIEKKNMNDQMERQVRGEIKLLRKLNHRYILKAYESFEGPDKLYFILELCTGGSLQDEVVHNGVFTEAQGASLMYQLLDAVNYMHTKGIAHRDLKPENILFSDMSKKVIKIIDFGFGKDTIADTVAFTMAGTLDYIAPEIIEQEEYDYAKIDCWSCGCIAYFLLFGKAPFSRKTLEETLVAIRRSQLAWSSKHPISDLAKNFVLSLLCLDASERLDASEAAQHPWLAKFRLSRSTTNLDLTSATSSEQQEEQKETRSPSEGRKQEEDHEDEEHHHHFEEIETDSPTLSTRNQSKDSIHDD